MRISIATPEAADIMTGNRCTADQWAGVLRSLGHAVEVVGTDGDGAAAPDTPGPDLLVALHGVKSAAAIRRFHSRRPDGRVVLVLTGTDLYGDPAPEAEASMRAADRLVVLQERALDRLPPRWREKARVIVQSARPGAGAAADAERSRDPFLIGVACHLRAIKDPLRAAEAARLLPPSSRIRILHAGAILEESFRPAVEREMRENPRYEWLGEVDGGRLSGLMASCQATVVSSRSEGGARVAGESIVAGTPVISSRIDGMIGLLGDDYPGYFPYGDTRALADLLLRLETDDAFRAALRRRTAALAPRFDPARERDAWAALLDELDSPRLSLT